MRWVHPWRLAPALGLSWVGCATRTGLEELPPPPLIGELPDPGPPTSPADLGPVGPWLDAHAAVSRPMERLGGPVTVRLTQTTGGAYAFRPAADAPDLASAMYGDAFVSMYDAKLQASLVDRTAADAAVTEDEAAVTATWEDSHGNVYEVRCCTTLTAHGTDHPTFGGVATNQLLHAFTDADLPAVFTYAAVWGSGEVLKNGQLLEEDVPVHLMLTEALRDEDLAMLRPSADPSRRQLHLLAEPARITPDGRQIEAAVHTGYTLPGGEAMPFWHIMFPAFKMEVEIPRT